MVGCDHEKRYSWNVRELAYKLEREMRGEDVCKDIGSTSCGRVKELGS